jgi:hypothetical protein
VEKKWVRMGKRWIRRREEVGKKWIRRREEVKKKG